MKRLLCALCLFLSGSLCLAVTVIDDIGQTVTVRASGARRIVSLSPHLTEILYAIGAGPRVIGVTLYSDYPDAVQYVPVVGDFKQIDAERILALRPDLIVAWDSPSMRTQTQWFVKQGIPVFYSKPQKLADIPGTMKRLGQLAHIPNRAEKLADDWMRQMQRLKRIYANKSRVDVFYLISDTPLYTLSNQHILREVFDICGADNVFADLSVIAPNITPEAVLAANPEMFITTSLEDSHGLASWRKYRQLKAVKRDNFYFINPDFLNRAGPRLLLGAKAMCRAVDAARMKRD